MSSGGSDFTFLTVAEVRVLVQTPLEDAQLADVLQREAAWLARRIGPLEGERIQTVYVGDPYRDDPIMLRRPTSAVTVTDNGADLDASQVRLMRGGHLVERSDAPWTGPKVEIAYEPNDEEEVARALIELVRLTVAESPYSSERIGDYSYQRSTGGSATMRQAIVRDLLAFPGMATTRLRSAVGSDRVGAIE